MHGIRIKERNVGKTSLEVQMIKIILVALPTAVLAFAAGVWAQGERH